MAAALADGLMRSTALGSIRLYQRHLSPRKGFRCAHNALHKAGSCSNYGISVFAQYPLTVAWRMLRQRFAECYAAKTILASSASEREDEKRKNRRGDSVAGGIAEALGDAVSGIFDACGGCDAAPS